MLYPSCLLEIKYLQPFHVDRYYAGSGKSGKYPSVI